MFENVIGLTPEQAARLTELVERCRPVLANDGMDAVQELLVELDVGMIPAITVTRGLLGFPETPLPVATEIVVTSPARNR